jgi:hypothetical protein
MTWRASSLCTRPFEEEGEEGGAPAPALAAEAGDMDTDTRVPPPPPGWRREVIPRKTVVGTNDKVETASHVIHHTNNPRSLS